MRDCPLLPLNTLRKWTRVREGMGERKRSFGPSARAVQWEGKKVEKKKRKSEKVKNNPIHAA